MNLRRRSGDFFAQKTNGNRGNKFRRKQCLFCFHRVRLCKKQSTLTHKMAYHLYPCFEVVKAITILPSSALTASTLNKKYAPALIERNRRFKDITIKRIAITFTPVIYLTKPPFTPTLLLQRKLILSNNLQRFITGYIFTIASSAKPIFLTPTSLTRLLGPSSCL